MIEALKRKLLAKYLMFRMRRFKESKNQQNFKKDIQSVKNVLLVLPAVADKPTAIQNFKAELYKIFGDVKLSSFEKQSLRKSDCNWLGVPNETYIRNFQDHDFDLAIDLNLEPDILSTFLTVTSGAALRINIFSGSLDEMYNLHVRTSGQKTMIERMNTTLDYLRKFKN